MLDTEVNFKTTLKRQCSDCYWRFQGEGEGPFPSLFIPFACSFLGGKLAKIIGWYPTMELAVPLGMIALHSNSTFRKFNTFSGQSNEL